jgi:hypothetical protein
MILRTLRPVVLPFVLTTTLGCSADVGTGEPAADPRDECALCAGKADAWDSPAEGSCDAQGLLRVANEASFEELDIDARLNRRAAENIVEAREADAFDTLTDVDDVPYVGVSALQALLDYARARGLTDECTDPGPGEVELGFVSDLDKTVIPPAPDGAELPAAPYPGVTTLYRILEIGADGSLEPGDLTYVTARSPDRLEGVPEWLAEHGLPEGPIETGTTGIPHIAQAEKVRDISRTFDASPEQAFVLFGDSSHRDPEAYKEILALYPDRVRAGIIHRVTMTVSPGRVEGLYLVDHYPQAAAILASLEILTEEEAWLVYEAAVAEGLELEEEAFRALLETPTP